MLPTSTFDIVYAYSVFSHLNESVHLAWVQDLTRVLRPGGLLVVTTRSRGFIDLCSRLREESHPAGSHAEAISRLFPDSAEAHAAYDRGEFLHFATGGGTDRPASFYGETVIPPRYVERNWTSGLELVDFKDDSSFQWQALVVLRKPTT
jgi:SAM-dependent methyltransferase